MSATMMIHTLSQNDVPWRSALSASSFGRTSRTAIQSRSRDPISRSNGIWSNAVTMPTKRRRSTTAPTVPQI